MQSDRVDGVHETHLDGIDRAPLFAGLAAGERRALASLAAVVRAKPGECIVDEGSAPQALFIIVDGEVEIARRRLGAADERHALRRLGPGESFGELALLEELPASASVYAATPTTLLALPIAELRRAVSQQPAFQPLFRGLAEQLNGRLRSLTDVTVRALEREVAELRGRVAMGNLLIGIVAILSMFAFSLSVGPRLSSGGWHNPFVLLSCATGLTVMGVLMRRTGLPLAFWGFTTRGWQRAVREAVLWSVPFVVAMVGVKWVALRTVDGWQHLPLFALPSVLTSSAPHVLRDHVTATLVYLLVAVPLQESVIRGCVQGAMQEFLTGRHRAAWAIVTSNLIFSVTHSHMSPAFAGLTILPGLLWGWLYWRTRTLIAPMLSHALIGMVALDLVGILEFLH